MNGVEVTVRGPMGSGGAPNGMLTLEQAAAVAYLSAGRCAKWYVNSRARAVDIYRNAV